MIFGKKSGSVSTASTESSKTVQPKDNKPSKSNQSDEKPINPNFTTNIVPGEYKPWEGKRTDGKKVAYLTFDDGPSVNTLKILNILKENNIKATFFLIGKNAEQSPDLVKEEVSEGHVVGNHTYSHPINYMKESPDKFAEDVNHADRVIKSILGSEYNKKLVRFPGGYMGHKPLPVAYRDVMIREGYHFIDWNDETGDADHNNVPAPILVQNLKRYTDIAHSDTLVILMHDAAAKSTSVVALPEVIQYLKEKGYTFDVLQ